MLQFVRSRCADNFQGIPVLDSGALLPAPPISGNEHTNSRKLPLIRHIGSLKNHPHSPPNITLLPPRPNPDYLTGAL